MSLKMWHLALMLFLIVAISDVVSGQDPFAAVFSGWFGDDIKPEKYYIVDDKTGKVDQPTYYWELKTDSYPNELALKKDISTEVYPIFFSALGASSDWANPSVKFKDYGFQYDSFSSRMPTESSKPKAQLSGSKLTDLKTKLTQQGIGTPQLSPPTSDNMLSDKFEGDPGILGTEKSNIQFLPCV